MGTNISPQKSNIEDDVSFPKGEYVSSLEGNECETSRRFWQDNVIWWYLDVDFEGPPYYLQYIFGFEL